MKDLAAYKLIGIFIVKQIKASNINRNNQNASKGNKNNNPDFRRTRKDLVSNELVHDVKDCVITNFNENIVYTCSCVYLF